MSLGNNGDLYIDRDTGDYYAKIEGVWILQGNLMGPQGEPGDQGIQGPQGLPGTPGAVVITADLLFGAGVPDDSLGIDGQVYVDTDTDNVYKKISGHWTLQTNIRGADGLSFLSGNGAPDNGNGKNGDSYVDLVTGNVYAKSAGTWTATGSSLKGPKGDKGDKGDTGSNGATGATGLTGPKGDKGDTGDIGPTGATGSAGSNGTNGSNGADGLSFHTGTGAPSDSLGNNGDTYLDTATGNIYAKSAGTWGSPAGSVKGDKGDTGATGATGAAGTNGTNGTNGARGSVWSTGSSVPGNSSPTGVLDGDFFLLSTTGEVYEHVSGVWTDQGFTIKGAAGAAGSAGSTGATGATGARGALWYTGSSLPDNSHPTGVANGDFFLLSTTGEVYEFVSGAWTDQSFSLKGPTGATGGSGGSGGGFHAPMDYLFETSTTNSAPASGKFRFSMASFTDGTAPDTWSFYINKTDHIGTDQSTFWAGVPVSSQHIGRYIMANFGYPDLPSLTGSTQPYIGKITAVTDHTGYVQIDVIQVSAPPGTQLSANDEISITVFEREYDYRPSPLANGGTNHFYGLGANVQIGGVVAFQPTGSTMYCVPFDVRVPIFVNSLGLVVSQAGTTGSCRVMILRRLHNFASGSVAGGSSIIAGTTVSNALASTGNKETNIFRLLDPGQYWLCLAVSTYGGTPQIAAFRARFDRDMDISLATTTWSRVQTFTVAGDKTGGLSTMPDATANTVALPTGSSDGYQFIAPMFMRWSEIG